MIKEVNFKGVLYFEINEKKSLDRVRNVGKQAGEDSKSLNEKIDILKKRHKTFNNRTKPVIALFDKKLKLFKINADNSKTNVFHEVRKSINIMLEIPAVVLNQMFASAIAELLKNTKPKSSEEQKATILIVQGADYSGKTTQCQKLVDCYNFKHLQVDKILDSVEKGDDDKAKIIKSCREQGTQVPNDLIVSCIKDTMKSQGWDKSKFLLNGYPKSLEHHKSMEKFMGNGINVKGLLYLKCNQQTSLERSKTVLSDDGRAGEQFKEENKEMKELLDHFKKNHKLFEVDSNGKPDDVFKKVKVHIEKSAFPGLQSLGPAEPKKPSFMSRFCCGAPKSSKVGTE